jgi:putative endopeptidase
MVRRLRPDSESTACRRLLVSLALLATLALAGCSRQGGQSNATPASAAPAAQRTAPSIDESALVPTLHFSLGDVDTDKDPCTDFFGYVNDKWLAANPIPADRAIWGPALIAEERALGVQKQIAEQVAANTRASGLDKIIGDFWASGMDETAVNAQGLKPLESRLAEIDALTDPSSIAEFLRTSAARGEGQVFGIGPSGDFVDSSQTIAYAVQGGLGLPDRGYYFDEDKHDKLAAYQAHVAKLLELAGLDAHAAAAEARAVIDFETRLAKASRSTEDVARDVSLYYNPLSPADADKLTPHFSWTKFFEAQGIAVPARFSLAMPGFHQEVDKMLGDEPLATWQAYLRFHVLDGASPYLSDPFAREHYEFYDKTMRGQSEMEARWKRVLATIETDAGEAMGQLYVQAVFPPESKAQMQTLVGNLRTALAARIERLDWMSAETKQKALAKLTAFRAKIGYPDKWRDWSGLQTSRDSYLGDIFAAEAFNYRWQLGKIGKPTDKTEWITTPQTVDAFYNPLQNEITFPAAILQPPYFDPNADEATNYGGIGAVIGHELTHGYDDQGRRFGPSGNFDNWWTDADASGFAARAERLMKQFDAYEALPGLHVNGRLTLGENIADLGGVATAYDAMKLATADKPDPMLDGLSRDRRFFFNYGTGGRSQITTDMLKTSIASDPHAPMQFRVIGPLSNTPAFAAAFSCEAGQPMARADAERVVIW